MAAVPSSEKTGEIRSASSGSDQHALTTNTAIVIGGASGDLAKKKVSNPLPWALSSTSIADRKLSAGARARKLWEPATRRDRFGHDASALDLVAHSDSYWTAGARSRAPESLFLSRLFMMTGAS